MKQGDIVYVRFDSMCRAFYFGEIVKCLVVHAPDGDGDWIDVIPVEQNQDLSIRKDYVTHVQKQNVFLKKSHFFNWKLHKLKHEMSLFFGRYNKEVSCAKKEMRKAEKEESEVSK